MDPTGPQQETRTATPALPEAVRRSTYVVIAAYDEECSLPQVLESLLPEYPHVVVVDDGSGDASAVRAAQAGARVLRHAVNRGQGAALQTGIDYSLAQGARYVVTFDADGQHCHEDIPALLAPVVAGRASYALGSRFLGRAEGMPRRRRLLLRLAVLFTRLTSGAPITDAHNGARAMSREGAARVQISQDRMAHASELVDQIVRSGLPWTEVPVTIRYTDYSRAKGQASLGALRIAFNYLVGRVLG